MFAEDLLSTSGPWCVMLRFTRRTNPSKAVWMLISLIFAGAMFAENLLWTSVPWCVMPRFTRRTNPSPACTATRAMWTPIRCANTCGTTSVRWVVAHRKCLHQVRMFIETFFFIHKLQFYSTVIVRIFIFRHFILFYSFCIELEKEMHVGRENSRH